MDPREKGIYRTTLAGMAVNAVLVGLKFAAGVAGRSSAMTADAVHSLSDFVTDIIVLVFVKISGKPQDAGHDYGHSKYETFATMVIGLILAAAGAGLFLDGVNKIVGSLRGESLPQPSMLALAVAAASILSKEILYRYTVRRGKIYESRALEANAWHHRSDAISSVGTLAGVAGAIFLGPGWRILDPIAAIVVSLFIVKAGYDIMRPSIDELLESSLPEACEKEIGRIVLSVPGVANIHNLRTRRIGNGIAIDLHARMNGAITLAEAHAIAHEAERRLKRKYGPGTWINIHMEPAAE